MNCLDAETLATWMDGGLQGASRQEVEAHVAACDRCQMLLGAMARTRAAVPAIPEARVSRRWLAWAVPLAAAATAMAIWVAVPQPPNTPPAPLSAPSATRAENEPAVAPFAPSAPPPTAAPVAPERKAAPLARRDAATTLEDRQASASDSSVALPGSNEPSSQPVPKQSFEKSEAAAGVAESAPVTPAAPEPERAKAADATANRITGRIAALASPAAPSIQMLCGQAWTSAPSDVAGQLAGGSSPSPNVCWVVGRSGVVRLSTNRQTWQAIRFPDTTDLSRVQAFDASTAIVTTVDGRSFRTVDGGMTWMPQ